MRRPLRDYQKAGLKFCIQTEHPALFWEMRLGKTLVVIRAEKFKQTKNILITAPYSALMGWEEELDLEGKRYITLDGLTKDRLNLLDKNFDKKNYILISKECHRYVPEIADFSWDTLIVDEGHCLREPEKNSKKTKKPNMSRFYVQNFRNVLTRYILTGTPAPESELNYFNLIRFLSHQYWSFDNYWSFRNRLFYKAGFDYKLRDHGYQKIASTLSKYCSVLHRKDINLGGDSIDMVRKVEFTPKLKKIYNKIEKEFALVIKEEVKNETVWATTKHLWLRRLCGGWADKEFISYCKLNELKYLLNNQFKKEQTTIFCHFKKEVYKIHKLLQVNFNCECITGDTNKRKRKLIIKKFRKKEVQHLVCHPGVVQEGVNISNCDIEIFYSLPESGLIYEQVKDRFIDVTSSGSKLIIYLIVNKTIEEIIYKRLKRKWDKERSMQEYIKYLRKKWIDK